MASEGNESDFSGFDYDDEREPVVAFRKQKNLLNINNQYVRSWSPANAVRELIQNWEDALRTQYEIGRSDFRQETEPEARLNETRIIVRSPLTEPGKKGHMIGYILFRGGAETLEFANFKAEIKEQHLYFGGTTKTRDRSQAGGHGEGLKVAAFVLSRAGYCVQIETGGWHLNFKFDKNGRFYYRPREIKRARRERQGDKCIANYWEDVKVMISRGKGYSDLYIQSTSVKEKDFREWMEVSFDLSSPRRDTIHWTPFGALSLDPLFQDRIYLKGLRMTDGSASGHPFKYCYNFFEGDTDRDRHSMTAPREEADLLARIWATAIVHDDCLADRYIDLLLNHSETAADVAQAEKRITQSTAQTLYARLRALHPEKFFYCSTQDSELGIADQRRTIEMDLSRVPMPLSVSLWRTLHWHNLVVDPLTYRRRKFSSCPPVKPAKTCFASSILRLLCVCLSLHHTTCDLVLDIREAGRLNADAIMIPKHEAQQHDVVLLHARWFFEDRAHRVSPCARFEDRSFCGRGSPETSHFHCDHVVIDLLESIFREVGDQRSIVELDRQIMRRFFRKLISQMPRHIRLLTTPAPRTLQVEWCGDSAVTENSLSDDNLGFLVVLHNSTSCAAKRNKTLHILAAADSAHRSISEQHLPHRPRQHHSDEGSLNTSNVPGTQRFASEAPSVGQPLQHEVHSRSESLRTDEVDIQSQQTQPGQSCNCARKIVKLQQTSVIFDDLEVGQAYFPMVARLGRDQRVSIYAEPPPGMVPRAFADSRRMPACKSATVSCSKGLGGGSNAQRLVERISPGPMPESVSNDDNNDDHLELRELFDGLGTPIDLNNNNKQDDLGVRGGPTAADRQMTANAVENIAAEQLAKDASASGPGSSLGERARHSSLLYLHDRQLWTIWMDSFLPQALAELSPTRSDLEPSDFRETRHITTDLPFDIEAGDFAIVEPRVGSIRRYVFYIHAVDNRRAVDEVRLKVTKHILLQSSPLQVVQADSENQREMLMFFSDASQMGLASDGEIVQIRDFHIVGRLKEGISYIAPSATPPVEGCFCRFAVATGLPIGRACIRPLSASTNLLARKDRTPALRFQANPRLSLFDLTPGIIGLAEGFAKAAFTIAAAIRFDASKHATWRCRYRHLGTEIFDGFGTQGIEDFGGEDLCPEALPSPRHPKIACVAAPNSTFRLTSGNSAMPTKEDFCEPLDVVRSAASSRLKPDFIVLVTSPAMLHDSVAPKFSETARSLLGSGFAVQLRIVPVKQLGLPQERSLLVLLASKSQDLTLRELPDAPAPSIGTRLNKLKYPNPRSGRHASTGFVYTRSLEDDLYDEVDAPMAMETVYNHQTNCFDLHELQRIKVDVASNEIFLSNSKMDPLVHAHRGDKLTVREICQLQGLEDDFVLYGDREQQYTDALNAVPPALGEWLGSSIFSWVTGNEPPEADAAMAMGPSRKRARDTTSERGSSAATNHQGSLTAF